MSRFIAFIRDAVAGYEPTVVRSLVVAVFVLLASFGIGSGELPAWAEGVLTFLAFVVPLIGGWLIRRKVIPVKSVDLPADPYPGGYEAAMRAAEAA